jgi:hypothetical protein
MSNQDSQNVPIVSYVTRDLFDRVQQDAKHSNRSLAGQVREVLSRAYASPMVKPR